MIYLTLNILSGPNTRPVPANFAVVEQRQRHPVLDKPTESSRIGASEFGATTNQPPSVAKFATPGRSGFARVRVKCLVNQPNCSFNECSNLYDRWVDAVASNW
jgi:hypothetical protein